MLDEKRDFSSFLPSSHVVCSVYKGEKRPRYAAALSVLQSDTVLKVAFLKDCLSRMTMEHQLYENTYLSEQSHWWFVGRRTLVLDQLDQLFAGHDDLQILDVGCGTGLNMEYLDRYGDVTGVDLSPVSLSFCRERGREKVVLAPVENLPFEDDFFDLVTALDVMEHLDDDDAGFREIYRVLKPGGRAVVLVPAYRFLWSLQDEVSNHKRRYVASHLSAVILRAGLLVDRLTYANTFLFPVIFGGRLVLKVLRRLDGSIQNENALHPGWSNGILRRIFEAEAPVLRRMRFPFGVSILAVARKPV
jgi:SAM-dependent methyltransferase